MVAVPERAQPKAARRNPPVAAKTMLRPAKNKHDTETITATKRIVAVAAAVHAADIALAL
jgi:hypothetical protein